eukprot:4785447-Pyramimonas_sp.AAC.1
MAKDCLQYATKPSKVAPREPKMAPRWPPGRSQDAFKIAQMVRGSSRRPKKRPRGPQNGPREFQKVLQ